MSNKAPTPTILPMMTQFGPSFVDFVLRELVRLDDFLVILFQTPKSIGVVAL